MFGINKQALSFGAAPPPPIRLCRVLDGGLFTARSVVGGLALMILKIGIVFNGC